MPKKLAFILYEVSTSFFSFVIIGIKFSLQKSSLTMIEYFFHSMPGGTAKHIPLTVIPPEGDLQVRLMSSCRLVRHVYITRLFQAFHTKPFVEVTISYHDVTSTRRETKEHILFSNESLNTCRTKRSKGSKSLGYRQWVTIPANELKCRIRNCSYAMILSNDSVIRLARCLSLVMSLNSSSDQTT